MQLKMSEPYVKAILLKYILILNHILIFYLSRFSTKNQAFLLFLNSLICLFWYSASRIWYNKIKSDGKKCENKVIIIINKQWEKLQSYEMIHSDPLNILFHSSFIIRCWMCYERWFSNLIFSSFDICIIISNIFWKSKYVIWTYLLILIELFYFIVKIE